ncbi:MAG: 50S ribosomal protein L24 [bacterium]|nr:50S ribosomal protein L24 [bacterium]
MKIKKNDTIKVLAGKDRGKTGKVLRVFPEQEKIVVEGINVLAKHVRPAKKGERGQKVYFPARMAVSNGMLVCPSCGKPTRVGYAVSHGEGAQTRKERLCKKCKSTFI